MNHKSRFAVGISVLCLLFCSAATSGARGEIPFKHVVVDDDGPTDMHCKAIGDINGDGFPDLVVAGTNGSIVWYEYPHWTKHVISTGRGGWSCDVKVGDINGDGHQEIVISDWYGAKRIVWFENPGKGVGKWKLHVIGGPEAHDIELADLNRDGKLDIVTRRQSAFGGDLGSKLEIWIQKDPDSWTHRAVKCPAGEGLAVADLNGDGRPDLIIGGRWYETPVDVAKGQWKEHVYTDKWKHPHCVVKVGDLNRDGRTDIVLSPAELKGGAYRIAWYEAPTDPKKGPWTEHVIDSSVETVVHGLAVADMNNDGEPDVVAASMHQGKAPQEVRVYVNGGQGVKWTKQVVATTGSHNIRVADFGRNGNFDIIGANWTGSKRVDLWENLTNQPKKGSTPKRAKEPEEAAGKKQTRANPAAELPGRYFRLMEAELALIEKRLEAKPAPDARFDARHYPGVLLAAAVLYAKRHADNPSCGDKKRLALALKVGDLLAGDNERGRFKELLNHQWGTYLWLEAYRLLAKNLGDERRARWRKELEKNIQVIADDTARRVDYPRYQSPFIITSPNHYSLWASTVYLAGRVFKNKHWQELGARVMHRFAAEEQTPDGYWGEHNDSGPTTGYNTLTLTGLALYWEHSGDTAALAALRRATDFHKYFTYPDGTPVEVINDRNRYWAVSPWGHFGFSHFADGRRYAEFLTGFFQEGKLSGDGAGVVQILGRIAQNALYYHEGPTAPIPQDRPHYAHQMKVPAGIRKAGPWVVCLSGLISTQAVTNQYYLDRQGHVSVFHETLGPIVTGANSKRQPELATFTEKVKDQVYHMPVSSRLRMSDQRDRLGLAYNHFFAELEVTAPSKDRAAFRFNIVECSRLEEAQLTLQLCLKAGEVLETAKAKVVLGDKRVALKPEDIGGWIRHRGWTLRVDPTARLTWPVYPFNPYRNGPETELAYAVGALSVPLRLKASSGSQPRTQAIEFTVEANPGATGQRPGGPDQEHLKRRGRPPSRPRQ